MKKYIVILLVVILFGMSIFTVKNYNNNKIQNSNNKDAKEKLETDNKVKATDFKLKDLNGKEVFLSDFKGKKVFLNFWATWCPPCKAEMPAIEKLYQETKDSDVVILVVNLGEDKQTVKSFIEKNKYTFNVLLDSNQEAAPDYNIVSIPTSFFIDKDGNIVSKKIGAMSIEEMKSYVK